MTDQIATVVLVNVQIAAVPAARRRIDQPVRLTVHRYGLARLRSNLDFGTVKLHPARTDDT
ncbi:hypothetical protein [Fodinicola feengrottensis]|uniref:hypothetical protein n=1 Tax=Fodinicola feengrottensis TaxID=435914 RepID=UPI0013D23D0B|nr:hypothetical protein [Fodinicola feengrottensis]